MYRLRRRAQLRLALCLLLPAGICLVSAGCAIAPAHPASTGSIVKSPAASDSLARFALAMGVAQSAEALSDAKADAVMARAIAEHEMRRP
ncbi:MAG: hypothetical protein HC869_21620 [Rhodospirillales bacterium]|nr:hypothetical protein [Rhodospirillales bacterium]